MQNFRNILCSLDNALIASCISGHVDIASMLLEGGADINCSDKNGRTPAMYAVSEGHMEIINLFEESRKINWNCRDSVGETVIFGAMLCNDKSMLERLSRIDEIDWNLRNDNNETLLSKGRVEKLIGCQIQIKVLIPKGANLL